MAQLQPQSPQLAFVNPAPDTLSELPRLPVKPAEFVTPDFTSQLSGHSVQPIPIVKPQHYGFFCKVEENMVAKSRFASRFRLGSPAYVDWLEGKFDHPEYRFHYWPPSETGKSKEDR